MLSRFIHTLAGIAGGIIGRIRASRLARILLLIVLIKFLVFYGFLKGFLYPRYLKPKYENTQHRSDEVMKDLLQQPSEKTNDHDRKH